MDRFLDILAFVGYYALVAAVIIGVVQLAMLMPWVFFAVLVVSPFLHRG